MYNSVRYTFGTICLAMALLVNAYPVTATSFTEYWRATYFRVVKVARSDFNQTSGQLCLGPAEWKVEGTFGAQSFEETWRVGNYTNPDDVTGWTTSGNLSNAFATPTYEFSDNCVDDDSISVERVRVVPTGVYGGFSTVGRGSGSWIDSWSFDDDVMGLRSMPNKWTINGTISL